MQKTYLGEAIKKHVKKKKVLVGDALPHFEGVGLNGEPFDWSVTDGKRVLLPACLLNGERTGRKISGYNEGCKDIIGIGIKGINQ